LPPARCTYPHITQPYLPAQKACFSYFAANFSFFFIPFIGRVIFGNSAKWQFEMKAPITDPNQFHALIVCLNCLIKIVFEITYRRVKWIR
jgi:hypothetical protein